MSCFLPEIDFEFKEWDRKWKFEDVGARKSDLRAGFWSMSKGR